MEILFGLCTVCGAGLFIGLMLFSAIFNVLRGGTYGSRGYHRPGYGWGYGGGWGYQANYNYGSYKPPAYKPPSYKPSGGYHKMGGGGGYKNYGGGASKKW